LAQTSCSGAHLQCAVLADGYMAVLLVVGASSGTQSGTSAAPPMEFMHAAHSGQSLIELQFVSLELEAPI
jgi:hypothetical protein